MSQTTDPAPSPQPEPTGSLDTALAHAARLLPAQPRLALEQVDEILRVVPGQPVALLYRAAALRLLGETTAALEILEPLAARQAGAAVVHYELGLACAAAGRGDEALAALRRAVEINPGIGEAWRALADHLHALGDANGADNAYARYLRASTKDPRLLKAGAALCDNKIGLAEAWLREHLEQHPTDVAALRMLAEVAGRLGRYGEAERLLRHCLDLAPGFFAARHNLAVVLNRQQKFAEALAQVDRLLAASPDHPGGRSLKAAVLGSVGEFDSALALYEGLVRQYPGQAKLWMSYGHSLKTAGRQAEAIEAYERCIGLAPHLGEAWWSLANLKTFRFTAAQMDAMRAQLGRDDLAHEDRFHFEFALGKALEDQKSWEESFTHYAEGNRLRRQAIRYDAAENHENMRRAKALFTAEFFAAREGWGCPAPDPVFIVGLPRAGSTLVEQILASHSAVEGTMELPDIMTLARELGGRKRKSDPSRYPEILAELDRDAIRGLGERYLERTRIQRKTAATFFIDKMPNNFAHLGLIHLALPNARVIDARRHPLGCGFSVFKQHFARGQKFSYDLEGIGRYYRDYVELMAHFDAVLPGRVHRVIYEEMVGDTEGQVRRLLQYCNLPFEEACLRFFENDRPVRTASSEQVRQPIYRAGVEQWQHYAPWLAPLRAALGEVLDAYPAVPAF